MQNVTNMTSVPPRNSPSKSVTIIWCVLFFLLAAAIVAGNTLTILIFTMRQFQRRAAHLLLINLTSTDLAVGAISIPLYVYLTGYQLWNIDSVIVPPIYELSDVLSGLTSIFSIAVISLERLYAIIWPFKHRLLGHRAYIVAITICWLSAGAVATVLSLYKSRLITLSLIATTHLTVVSKSTPLVITIAAYASLWKMKKKLSVFAPRTYENDLRLAHTLFIMTLVFFLTWSPFLISSAIFNYSYAFRKTPTFPSPSVLHFIKLLQYGNSLANPIIYALRIPVFRRELKHKLCPRHTVGTSNTRVNHGPVHGAAR